MGRGSCRNNHQLLTTEMTAVFRIFSNSKESQLHINYKLTAQQRNGSKLWTVREGTGSLASKCHCWGSSGEETLLVLFEVCDAREILLVLQGYAQLEAGLTIPGKAYFTWKVNNHPHKSMRLGCFSSVKSKSLVSKLTWRCHRCGTLMPFSLQTAAGVSTMPVTLWAEKMTSLPEWPGAHHQAWSLPKETPLSEAYS